MTSVYMEKKWYEILQEEFQKEYMQQLRHFLQQEREDQKEIYPPHQQIFQAFRYTPYDDVKVVIMGQDPYHGPNQAHGLSFSVAPGINIPPSLKNIYKELEKDVGIIPPTTGSLIPWAKQGVLLLNATLTVRAHEPRSHYGKGWEIFTDAVIHKLVKRKDPIVFLLWGRSAQEKCVRILDKETHHPHLVLTSAHPSPYSAQGFFGHKHFSLANAFLQKSGKIPIDWQI